MPWNYITFDNNNIKLVKNERHLSKIILANKAFTSHLKRYYSDIKVIQAFNS